MIQVDIAYAPFIERFQPFFAEAKNYDITKGRPKLALWIEVREISIFLNVFCLKFLILNPWGSFFFVYIQAHIPNRMLQCGMTDHSAFQIAPRLSSSTHRAHHVSITYDFIILNGLLVSYT